MADIRKWRKNSSMATTGFHRERPYNELPPLPPAVELETTDVLRAAINANRLLGELKGVGDVLPNQAILVNGIVLQEAKASSEIENIVTTNDAIYQALGREDSPSVEPHAKEVLRYREALWHGFEAIKQRPISTNLLIDIVGIIRRTDAGIRKTPGIKITGAGGHVVYTPPEGETLVRDLLGNLETFLHADDDLDPLIKLAVAHYQFEAIHPFADGNGRTGRILNILYLVDRGLLEVPVLFLSHYFIRTKPEYYEGLRRVTEEGAWVDWVLYVLRAIEETARETRERIVRIHELMEETSELAKREAAGVYSRELVELVFANPYSKVGFLVDAGIAKRQTASKYLKALESAGILKGKKVGREVYYVNERLIRVLAE